MGHLRPAHTTVVGNIAVCLENPLELVQEARWTFAPAAHAKIEDRRAARHAVLPQISLVVLAAAVMHLHIDRLLIGLVSRGTQIREYVLQGFLAAFKSRNPPSCLYSNPGPKLMHGKRIVSSLYLYPGQTSAGTSSGFYVQQSGISVQRQCS